MMYKKSRIDLWVSNQGIGIMAVTVAASLLATVVLGVMKMTQNMQKSSKLTRQNFEIRGFHDEIINFLANGDNCSENFKNKNPSSVAEFLTELKKSGGGVKYNLMTNYNGVRIKSMYFGGQSSNIAGSATFVTTKLKVCFQRFGSKGWDDRPVCPEKDGFQVSARLSGGVIDSCSSIATGRGVWKKNANGIHYSAGNIGIGTSAPVFPLHIDGEARANILGDANITITEGVIAGAANISASSMQLGGIGVATVNMIWGSLDDAQRGNIIDKLSTSSNEKVVADAIVIMALNSLSVDSSPCSSGEKVTGISYTQSNGNFIFTCENEDDPCIPLGGVKTGGVCNKVDIADIQKNGKNVATFDMVFGQLDDSQKESILETIVSISASQTGVDAISGVVFKKVNITGVSNCPVDEKVDAVTYNKLSGTFTVSCGTDYRIPNKLCAGAGEAIKEIRNGVANCERLF